MTLDEMEKQLSADVDASLAKMRAEEAEMERKFPGFPGYLREHTLERIQWAVEMHTDEMLGILEATFGIAGMNSAGAKMEHWVRETLRRMAGTVAHQAAGDLALEGAKQADRASANMLNACIAGMTLAGRRSE